ncbi:MAG: hypothetical protein MRY21_05490 [Simkaniaceae bacterium]|nr:hypothetical protein [Simkaniaceae bacterium]
MASEAVTEKLAGFVKPAFWEKLKEQLFNESSAIPFWALIGPLLTMLTTSVALAMQMQPLWAAALSIVGLALTWRLTLKGALAASLFTIAPLIVCCPSKLFAFFYLLSSSLSYLTFALTLEDVEEQKKALDLEKSDRIEELKLWKKRFETLSEKAEKQSLESTEALVAKETELDDLQDYIESLKELVDVSNLESKKYYEKCLELSQVPPAPAPAPVATEPPAEVVEPVDFDELLMTVEAMAETAVTSYVKYRDNKQS